MGGWELQEVGVADGCMLSYGCVLLSFMFSLLSPGRLVPSLSGQAWSSSRGMAPVCVCLLLTLCVISNPTTYSILSLLPLRVLPSANQDIHSLVPNYVGEEAISCTAKKSF